MIKSINPIIFIEFDIPFINKDISDIIEKFNFEISESQVKQELSKLINEYPIDSNTKVLFEFCKESNIDIHIVSKGLNYFISEIMKYNNIENFKYFSNKIVKSDGEKYKIIFDKASENCACSQGNCIRNYMLNVSSEDNIILFAGTSGKYSCCAEISDLVFAKGELSAFCNKNKISHYNFSNLFDIYRILKNIVKENKFRTRHQAFLNRKRIFEYE